MILKHSFSKKSSKNSREKVIMQSGFLFIAVNFFLGFLNIIVGIMAGSIAIISDAVHSFVDSISGFLIVISEKIASHRSFSRHKVKIERFTTIAIALIIVVVGLHVLIESVEGVLAPEPPEYSMPTIIILIVSLAIKWLLAKFLKRMGKEYSAPVLTVSGAETLNDTWISAAVLLSAVIYSLLRFNIEPYVGIAIALIIMKVGVEFIFPHLSHHHHHHLETDSDHDHCPKGAATK